MVKNTCFWSLFQTDIPIFFPTLTIKITMKYLQSKLILLHAWRPTYVIYPQKKSTRNSNCFTVKKLIQNGPDQRWCVRYKEQLQSEPSRKATRALCNCGSPLLIVFALPW